MSQRYHRLPAAFTLVELLIVIVIIGLLTGLATTSYINAQKTARDNTRKASVSSIANAVQAFYQAKRRFPGLIGNEASIPDLQQRDRWKGCLALDRANGYSSVVYYSYPTILDGGGEQRACNQRGNGTGFSSDQYGPYPNWIPELGEYLNPVPVERRYQASNGAASETLDSTTGSFTAAGSDVLGDNNSQALVYRHLVGGFMVYTRLEASTTDVKVGTPYTDTPQYGMPYPNTTGTAPIRVYKDNVFMIRQ